MNAVWLKRADSRVSRRRIPASRLPLPVRAVAVTFTALAVTAALIVGLFAAAADARTALAAVTAGTAGTAGTTMCEPGARVAVHDSRGRGYLVRNVSKESRPPACIKLTGGTGFLVTRTPARNGDVTAYPDITRGCIWFVCSPNSPFPLRVRDIKSLQSTWHTRSVDHGSWNAAYDLWLGRHKHDPDGRSTRDGAELMVWINYHGFGGGNWHRSKKIDGHRWYFTHWIHCDRRLGVCWKLIIFRIVHPRASVNDLHLRRFLAYAKHHRLIKNRWWLESVGGGFETWGHGIGMGTYHFNVIVHRR